MGAQAHSAFQAGEVSRREAEDRAKYGPGRVATEILSPIDRVWQRLKGAYQAPRGRISGDIYADPGARGWSRHFNPDGSLRK